MLVILVEPSIFRRMRNVTIADEQLPIVTYERTFNQAQVDYVLQTLSEVFKYGGPAFVKNLVGQKMVNESLLKLVRLMEAPVAGKRRSCWWISS